ncbi:alpha/beta hydrolase, partial [Mesorhizobium sp. M00.F.Ca.ET.149.01.1.1]
PETVAPFEPSAAEVQACKWLTESEVGVYAEEYDRTGFQGALQAYRVVSFDVPSLFIGGKSDWGTYSAPGALDLMRTKAATRMAGIELIDGAGHWIQKEQPVRLSTLLLAFTKEVGDINSH